MLVQTPFPTSSFLFVYLPWFSFLWLKKFIRTGRFSLLLVFILYLSSLYNKNIVSVPLLCMAGCGLSQSRSSFPHLCWGCSQLNICWTLDLSCRTVMILSWPLGFHLVFPPALRKPGQLRWWHLHQEKYCNADESQNWPTNQPTKKIPTMSGKLFRGYLFSAVTKQVCWIRLWSAAPAVKQSNCVGEGTVFTYSK